MPTEDKQIAESCPVTKLADNCLLIQLHSADDSAVTWLRDTATKPLEN